MLWLRTAARIGKTGWRLTRDPRTPRPVRWVLLVAALPIPGPVDEIALIIALAATLALRPGLLGQIWGETR